MLTLDTIAAGLYWFSDKRPSFFLAISLFMALGPLGFKVVTVDEMLKIQERTKGGDILTRAELERMARNDSMCESCEALPAWRYGDTGICFPCTTGESDASEDYELELIK